MSLLEPANLPHLDRLLELMVKRGVAKIQDADVTIELSPLAWADKSARAAAEALGIRPEDEDEEEAIDDGATPDVLRARQRKSDVDADLFADG